MMHFYLSNRPYVIYCGDREILQQWFAFYQEEGYDPVEISEQKASALLAEAPDEYTNDVWELRHKTQPPLV